MSPLHKLQKKVSGATAFQQGKTIMKGPKGTTGTTPAPMTRTLSNEEIKTYQVIMRARRLDPCPDDRIRVLATGSVSCLGVDTGIYVHGSTCWCMCDALKGWVSRSVVGPGLAG